MPLFGMIVMSWAFVTYFQITAIAIFPLVIMQFALFVVGWKYGRGYEKEQMEVRKEAVV